MRTLVRSESGQELVEFALASMVFFLVVFGIFSFGLAVSRYNFVADLAQEGARRATVCGSGKTLSSSNCDIPTYVNSRAMGLNVNTTTTPSDISTLSEGSSVTVQVTHTFNPITTLLPVGTLTLRSRATMIVGR